MPVEVASDVGVDGCPGVAVGGSAPVQTNTIPSATEASYIVVPSSGSSPVGGPTGGANLLVRTPYPMNSAMFSAAENALTLMPLGMRSSALRFGMAVQRPVAPSKLQPWYRHWIEPSSVSRPIDSGNRRCGQRSATARTVPDRSR